MLRYIADKDHYTEVLSHCGSVKHDLWIATADLKDLYVQAKSDAEPFLAVLDRLLKRGVEVRLLHAKEPTVDEVRAKALPSSAFQDYDF